jgi:hypothetical protein
MQDPDKHAMVSKYIETIDLNEVTYNLDNLANAQKSFEDFALIISLKLILLCSSEISL